MAALNNMLDALGIDHTLKFQLLIFLVGFLFLKYVVFDSYFAAYQERQKRTQGNEEKAQEIISQTEELLSVYQRKARVLNTDIKEIYDKARLEAALEQEKIQAEAREKAKATLDRARDVIQGEYNRAREELLKQTPEISKAIVDRLLPHEVRQ